MKPESDKQTQTYYRYKHIHIYITKTNTTMLQYNKYYGSFSRRYWPSSEHTNSIKKLKIQKPFAICKYKYVPRISGPQRLILK